MKIWQKNREICLEIITVFVVAVFIVLFLGLIVHYNHWIGKIARTLFVAIGILLMSLFLYFFSKWIDVTGIGNFADGYANLGIMISLLLIGLFFAGLTIQIKTPRTYEARFGKIYVCDKKLRWQNPFILTTVLPFSFSKTYETTSILFPNTILIVKPSIRFKLGASARDLEKQGYFSGNIIKEKQMPAVINNSVRYAILDCKVKNQNDVTPDEKLCFLAALKDEITKNIPPYLETGGVEINVKQL